MRIEVVNTGTELLLGKVVNTHAAYFGQELFKLGLRIQRQITIPDGEGIRVALEEAFPRSDLILVTGGLGPTNDDLTREMTAGILGRSLHLDSSVLASITNRFRRVGIEKSPANDRQAMVPEGALVLENAYGTAPGLYFPPDAVVNSPHIFLLPGPPGELRPMFETLVYPVIAELLDSGRAAQQWRNFKIFGVGESAIATALESRLDAIPGLEVGYCARLGEVDLRLIGSRAALEEASLLIRSEYAHDIATESEDAIEKVVFDLLSERGQTVATAESCTGGLIASTLTDVSGSSAIFQQGYVTYANSGKSAMLGVPEELIVTHGVVSDEVVRAMASGCLAVSGADHALAVSGVAGPGGGSLAKPVGTVFIALAAQGGEIFAKRYFYPMDRVSFKQRVTRLALDLLRRRLCGFALD